MSIYNTILNKYGKISLEKIEEISKAIELFVSSRSINLSTKDLSLKFPLTKDSDTNKILNIIGISQADIKEIINADEEMMIMKDSIRQKQTDERRIGANPLSNSADPTNVFFTILFILYYKYGIKESDIDKNAPSRQFPPYKLIILYIGIRFFAYDRDKYFKYENSEIFEYTLNNISRQFIIKEKVNSILEYLIYHCDRIMEADLPLTMLGLKEIDNETIRRFINYFRNRINGNLKDIAHKFHDNLKKKENIDVSDSNIFFKTQEDDEDLNTMSTVSSDVRMISNFIIQRFIQDDIVDKVILSMAANSSKEPPRKDSMEIIIKNMRRNIINKDADDNEDYLKTLIMAIINYFIAGRGRNKNEINSYKFYEEMYGVVKLSNSGDPNVVLIKDSLNNIFKTYYPLYKEISRAASQSAIKNTIYVYIILYIMQNYKFY